MPTSAISTARDSLSRRRRRGSRGFTLVELLVVLTIFGLMASAVVLALPGDASALTVDAERFAARAKAIHDKAIIGARATSIRVAANGYAFDERDGGRWRPIKDLPANQVAWKEGTQALVGQSEVMRIVFDATGTAEPARVTLQRGDRRVAITIAHDGKIDVVTS